MKITSKTFDIFELIVTILNKVYQCFKNGENEDLLSQQELLDYDFVFGQVGKVVLFLIQIIYYLDLNQLYKVETQSLIYGYYFFACFMVLVEQEYVYDGKSNTFTRIIANRVMNLSVNGITLYIIHLNKSLLYTWKNIKNDELEFSDILVISLVIFTGLEILELLFQLSTVTFSCLKNLNKTENFISQGGCIYLCIGQFIGIIIMGGSILLIYYIQKLPFQNLLELRIIVLEASVGLEFLFQCIYYCWNHKGKEDSPKSKKVLCFGYGFCIGTMGVISGPAILILKLYFTFIQCICCCFLCPKVDRNAQYQFENLNSNEAQTNKKNQP